MRVSMILPVIITLAGVFLLFRLRFFFLIHPIKAMKRLLPTVRDKSSRRALSLALAGTLGVGNIFGVCTGIAVGGAGCVFWMLVSSVFSMIIKYCECTLSFDALHSGKGGMHYVLSEVFGKIGKAVSCLYVLLCLLLAFFMGSAMQSRALSDTAEASFGLHPALCAPLLVAVVVFAVRGGGDKIEKITAKLIPVTVVLYVLLTLSVILLNFGRIGHVLREIMTEAFTLRASVCGVLAFLSSSALREGFARGILSNEAGIGTSSLAHTRSQGRSPAQAGMAGVCEVFFDSVVLCTLTALAVLCSSPPEYAYSSAMSLIAYAVASSIGTAALPFLVASVFIFAYSTLICWYYYGYECFGFLFVGVPRWIYFTLFLAFVIFGAVAPASSLVDITDVVIVFMAVPTLCALVLKSNRIKKLTFDEFF